MIETFRAFNKWRNRHNLRADVTVTFHFKTKDAALRTALALAADIEDLRTVKTENDNHVPLEGNILGIPFRLTTAPPQADGAVPPPD